MWVTRSMTFIGREAGCRHEARRRVGQQRRHAAGVDAEVLPRGNMAVDRVVEADQPLFDQHHQRDRGDRFRHRVDAEDRVLAHRLAALEVHLAAEAGMDELALAPDVGQHAGQIAAVDIAALHDLIQPRQPRRRHAYRFRASFVSSWRGAALPKTYAGPGRSGIQLSGPLRENEDE